MSFLDGLTFWDGVVVGVILTSAILFLAYYVVIPWLATLRAVRIWDRKAAWARRRHGSG